MSHILETERLLLRQPRAGDVPAIAALIGDYDVAKNLSRVPHPYTEDDGHAFVAGLDARIAAGDTSPFGITLKDSGTYIGGCGLHIEDGALELGYWLGKPHWGQGYASEAARACLGFAFDVLDAGQVWAGWYWDNPNSGHVLQKLGFVATGREPRFSLARGCDVATNLVILSRADFLAGRTR